MPRNALSSCRVGSCAKQPWQWHRDEWPSSYRNPSGTCNCVRLHQLWHTLPEGPLGLAMGANISKRRRERKATESGMGASPSPSPARSLLTMMLTGCSILHQPSRARDRARERAGRRRVPTQPPRAPVTPTRVVPQRVRDLAAASQHVTTCVEKELNLQRLSTIHG
jgi:hypothetical protein